MKTQYMKQVYMGTIGDMKNLEQHYSEMTEKGWMIDKIGLLTHRYHAIEPCKKRFFVDLLPQITAFDYPENEDAQDYRNICEESGWNFIAANKQFHVFCADSDNNTPIPIHTDNTIHAKIYLKASRKYELPALLYVLIMFCILLSLNKGVEVFLSNIKLYSSIGYLCYLFGLIWTLASIIWWYIRTNKAAKNNLPLPVVNRRIAKIRNIVAFAGVIILLVCMIIGITLEFIGGMPVAIMLVMFIPFSVLGVGLWIRRQIDTKRRTRTGNIGLAVAAIIITEIVLMSVTFFIITNMSFTFNSDSLGDRPALTLSDIGVMSEPSYSTTSVKDTLVFPVNYEHWESISGGLVRTQVYRSISKKLTQWLYEHLTEEFTKQFAYRLNDNYLNESIATLSSDEAAFWGAEKGIIFNYTDSNAIDVLLWNDKTILRITARGADMDLDTVSHEIRIMWGKVNQSA